MSNKIVQLSHKNAKRAPATQNAAAVVPDRSEQLNNVNDNKYKEINAYADVCYSDRAGQHRPTDIPHNWRWASRINNERIALLTALCGSRAIDSIDEKIDYERRAFLSILGAYKIEDFGIAIYNKNIAEYSQDADLWCIGGEKGHFLENYLRDGRMRTDPIVDILVNSVNIKSQLLPISYVWPDIGDKDFFNSLTPDQQEHETWYWRHAVGAGASIIFPDPLSDGRDYTTSRAIIMSFTAPKDMPHGDWVEYFPEIRFQLSQIGKVFLCYLMLVEHGFSHLYGRVAEAIAMARQGNCEKKEQYFALQRRHQKPHNIHIIDLVKQFLDNPDRAKIIEAEITKLRNEIASFVPDYAIVEEVVERCRGAIGAALDALPAPDTDVGAPAPDIASSESPLALPDVAPKLYRDREDKSQSVMDFLRDVWWPWMNNKLLTRRDLRRLDASAASAVDRWLRHSDLPGDIFLPTKKEEFDDLFKAGALKDDSLRAYRVLDARRRKGIAGPSSGNG